MTDAPPYVPLGKGLPLWEGRFIERPNMFTLRVDLAGRPVTAAMADRGRLEGVLTPGRPILMERRAEEHRKTNYQALAARLDDDRLASLDTQLPNRLVAQALEAGALQGLFAFARFETEQTIGDSRFDFVLHREQGRRCIVEVKSAGRIDADGVARFPDAPTERGVRHVEGLTELCGDDTDCAVLFVIQGDHAGSFAIDEAIDPDLARAIAAAHEAGVAIRAHACPFTEEGLFWGEEVAVTLPE